MPKWGSPPLWFPPASRDRNALLGKVLRVPPAGMTNPIFWYGRSEGCTTITGGAFVPSGVWPSAYDGDYLYGDFGCGSIFRLEPGAGGFTSSVFASGFGSNSVVDLLFAPAFVGSALYYTTIGGQVLRCHGAARRTLDLAPVCVPRSLNGTGGGCSLRRCTGSS